MRVLVIGAGGREHAIIWKLSQSPLVEKIFVAPGNAGMSGSAEYLPLSADKVIDLASFAVASRIDLTVVGPESPLVAGIVDYFQERNLKIFGPTKRAAQLEGSKSFAKSIMQKYGVPTAKFELFTDLEKALAYLDKAKAPIVVKADGLAGGKGVIVAQTRAEAQKAVNSILGDKIFGDAGKQVVIEEHLKGEEVSVLACVDGKNFILLESAQDHKRAYEEDAGPNTGGMGAYSPVPMLEPADLETIRKKIFEPVIRGMNQEGVPFTGILYAGLMLTSEGPKVLEFNVRFGDPEAQAVLPRLKSDFAELLLASVEGRLSGYRIEWDSRYSACVVLASKGYPGAYDIGRVVTGLEKAGDLPDTVVFHGGTEVDKGRILTTGGRVLNVVALGETLEIALEKAYRGVEIIQFEGKQFRRDIGVHALKFKECHHGR